MARDPRTGPKDGPKETISGREAIEEIDRRLGGLLGPLTEGLTKIVEAAEKAQAASGAREMTVDTGKGPMRFRAGYSVRVGGLGGTSEWSSERDPAEPVSTAKPKPAEPAPVEPIVDVFDGPEGWSLTADMPGVGLDDLTVRVAGGVVSVTADGARRYRVETEAPAWLTVEALERRLTNGVLELTAPRPEGAA
jgi:HSP20 family molecular chaperone IbpA